MLFKLNATLAQIIQKVYQKWIEYDNDGIIDKILHKFLDGLTEISLQFPLQISIDTFLYILLGRKNYVKHRMILSNLFSTKNQIYKLISSVNWIFGNDKIKPHFHFCFDCNPIIKPIVKCKSNDFAMTE